MKWIGLLLAAVAWSAGWVGAVEAAPPNIVWIVIDDMSPHLGCYGERTIETPRIDGLASRGVRFEWCFTTAPVCSPCRSALITGCYQTTLGAHHHRSGREANRLAMPEGFEPVPALLRRAGYWTCLGGPLVAGTQRLGKSDYNFEWDPRIYDSNDWAGRAPGQPFFMQVQLHGGKHREGAGWSERVRARLGSLVDAGQVTVPAYYPDDAVLREDWARYLDACRWTDAEVGEVLDRLEREGLLDTTMLVLTTDHGISHARGKQFLYDEGLRVPLIVSGPGMEGGTVRTDLAELIDLAPTTLALAGVAIPAWMQGRNLVAANEPPREMVFAARDRCDETVERLRSVRTHQYKYIQNGYPQRPALQPNAYKDGKPIVQRLRELHAAGELTELHERLLFALVRPREELYDLRADPQELRNLAEDPAWAGELGRLRQALADWQQATGDRGIEPEAEEVYEGNMRAYLAELPVERRGVVEANIEQMRRWAREGK